MFGHEVSEDVFGWEFDHNMHIHPNLFIRRVVSYRLQ